MLLAMIEHNLRYICQYYYLKANFCDVKNVKRFVIVNIMNGNAKVNILFRA